MDDASAAPSCPCHVTLGSLPLEILQKIFRFSTTTTFFQVIQVSHKFYSVASQGRELILYHLRHVPGIKLGLDDRSISTEDLFLIFRQRAASHLYGINFTANCRNLAPSPIGIRTFDPRSSCLAIGSDGFGSNTCVVFKNSLRVRLNPHDHRPTGDYIECPYADGSAKIVQVVQQSHYICVLYAWVPPDKDTIDDTAHTEPKILLNAKQVDQKRARDGYCYSAKQDHPRSAHTDSSARVHYHLVHYDIFRFNNRPTFFSIPTHKSLRNKRLVPIHLAVHNRLQVAILWDLPGTLTPSPHATVCLYVAEHIPRHEQGTYDVWVIYPFDHPSPTHRSSLRPEKNHAHPHSDSDDLVVAVASTRKMTYTYTQAHQPSHTNNGHDRSRDSDADLRLLHFPLKPRSIAFFREGRRLSLYAPGSSTPFTTLLANEAIRKRLHPPGTPHFYPRSSTGTYYPRNLCRRVRRTNHTSICGHRFTLCLPFYSKHETITRPPAENADPETDDAVPDLECVHNILTLGTGRIPTTAPEILTIVQIRKRLPHELCLHADWKDDLPSLPRPPVELRLPVTYAYPEAGQGFDHHTAPNVPDIPATHTSDGDEEGNNTSEPEIEILSDDSMDSASDDAVASTDIRVVARLWGWNAQTTTLTGLESVSVSARGERIAIAQWDKVLVYALDPAALCEEVWNDDDGSSDGGNSDDGASHNGESLASASVIDVESLAGDNSGGEDDDASATSVVKAENAMDNLNQDPSPNGGSSDGDHDPHNTTHHSASPVEPPPSIPITDPNPLVLTALYPPSPPSVSSSTSTSMSHLLEFYPHVYDKNLGGSIVQLRPIVLKMDGGAVVRKMNWGLDRRERAEEESDSSENDKLEVLDEEEDGGLDNKVENVKEKGAEEEMGACGSDVGHHAEDQCGGNAGTQHHTGMNESQARSAASSHSGADRPSDNSPKTCQSRIPELTPSSTPDDIPPAPFADVKLSGQIKHIGRPPEYYSFVNKIVLDHPCALRPPSPMERDTGKGKEKGSPQATVIGAVQEDSKSTMPTQSQIGAKRLDQPAPATTSASVEFESVRSYSRPSPKRNNKRRKRVEEKELVVITDMGIQIWDLSVWGTSKRVRSELASSDDCG